MIIYKGINSGKEDLDVSRFNALLRETEEKNNAVSILECTELPVARDRYNMIGNFINPTQILANAAIEKAGYSIRVR